MKPETDTGKRRPLLKASLGFDSLSGFVGLYCTFFNDLFFEFYGAGT